MTRARTLRSHLAFSYAGIALLTAVLLGGILLGVLSSYYARSEDAYLRAAAKRLSSAAVPAEKDVLANWVQAAALTTQTRVRVLARDGNVLADSGSPRDLDPGQLVLPGAGRRGEGEHERLPQPLGRGIFGGDTTGSARSTRTLAVTLAGGRSLSLSEAPASGRDVLVGVAQGWGVAAALAVLLAALAGALLSSRLSHPIVALTEVTDRMAAGDLTARAELTGGAETERLAESFNEMAEQMETTVVTLRRFVADAAHEIGTPLTALQADLELADAEAAGGEAQRLVRRALGSARRLEDLSGNLLRLSRIEAGEQPLPDVVIDLTRIAYEAADAVASRAEAAGLELSIDVAADALPVRADRSALAAVAANLLDNALKFTPSGGAITLSAHRDGAQALLEVADTGVGIPAAEQDAVFERFHRARSAAAYPGSGLGLAIVRATVEHAGGTVTLESSDAGTRVSVRLPLA